MSMHMTFLGSKFLIGISFIFVASSLANAQSQKSEFTYTGNTGPKHWASLSTHYKDCASGKSQSPINIITSKTTHNASLQPIFPSYRPAAAVLVNNKFNVEVSFRGDGGVLNVNGKDHTLKQFHLHVPSEHQVDGQHFAAELHIVHICNDGNLAVLGILFKLGPKDAFISQIAGALKNITVNPEDKVPIGSVNVSTILPNTDSFYRYTGSLTTPPCTEDVTWTVLSQVKTISVDQITAIKAAFAEGNKHNNRPVQLLNGRTVQLHSLTKPKHVIHH